MTRITETAYIVYYISPFDEYRLRFGNIREQIFVNWIYGNEKKN